MSDYNFNSLKKNGRYVNFHSHGRVRRTLLDFFLWKLGVYKLLDAKLEVPENFLFPGANKNFNAQNPWAVWIGHCSFLVKSSNIRVLTDPIWSEMCSPFTFIGPRRKVKPSIDIDQLTSIDYVLISHDHYDHLDKKSVLKLDQKFPNICWIVAKGIKKWFTKLHIYNVHELDWWENYEDEFVNVYSVPAQHYSGRTIFDGNKSLWCGFVLDFKKTEKKLYFTGDTGYNDIDFKMIGKTFKSMDLSLVPIGTYVPRKFMRPVHADPLDAIKIHTDVASKFTIGMHYKTFHLSDENMLLPPYELYLNLLNQNIDPKDFIAIDPGTYVNW